ncbi:AAA family ATPase (plasmid) [Nocardia sp. NBC_01377]|uniref:AAA family ATPase n=1 Tax=Nocardia sp. NBC_01377 TaxID=2903595 RepID=UPI002F916172
MTGSSQRVIAFEGLPFTGKSTAAAELERRYRGISVVPDYHELLATDARWRAAQLSADADDQHHRVAVYRDLDDQRWKSAAESSSPTIIFDRCYISIAAYRLALHTAFGLPGDPDTPDQAPTPICERPIPPVVVHFAVRAQTAVERHQRLARTIDPRMRTHMFLSALLDAYDQVLAASGARIITVDSNQPLAQVVAQACRHVGETF